MGNKFLRRAGKAINTLLAYGNLEIRKKSKKKKKPKFKKEEYIWSKVSMLPQVPTIIDIGIGPKGTPGLYRYFPDSRYLFIDALEECKQAVEERLVGGRNIFVTSAVGAENSSVQINIARKPSRSSLYKRSHSPLSEGIATREVALRRLDDIVSKYDLGAPFGVKIDTEGFELEVIKGAPETLKKTLFVVAEFHQKDAEKNSYTLHDLISLMDKAGFFAHFMLRDGRNIVFQNRKLSSIMKAGAAAEAGGSL